MSEPKETVLFRLGGLRWAVSHATLSDWGGAAIGVCVVLPVIVFGLWVLLQTAISYAHGPAHMREFRKLAMDPDICLLADKTRAQAVLFAQLAATASPPIKDVSDASNAWQVVAEMMREACNVSKLSGRAVEDAVHQAAERVKRYAEALLPKAKP